MPIIPQYFCWSRFGTEAGESVTQIIHRKEIERQQNNGAFLWGIGNALAPSMKELIKLQKEPEVLFSPIISRHKSIDISPPTTVIWTKACDMNGSIFEIPKYSKITSRQTPKHYALVCYSQVPITLESENYVYINNLKNILSNNKLGSSQVTAIVKYSENSEISGNKYTIAMRYHLVSPFFVILHNPIII